MTEHHGLDLKAIQKALGSHSIFAPSASHMWLWCSGSLIPNLLAKDDAGFDAAEGTVGHEVGEEWLLRIGELYPDGIPDPEHRNITDEELLDETQPTYLIGKVRTVVEPSETFQIEITAEMLGYVREYVAWCVALPGIHFVEQRVDFSHLTPLKNQKGTADHVAIYRRSLKVTDLKYGKGEEVYAAVDLNDPRFMFDDGELNGHTQTLLYAYGVFLKYDDKYHFDEIVIRIAQPRRGHWQEWTTTRGELLKFAAWVKIRAALAWDPNAPRRASTKGCRWCKVKKTCATVADFLQEGVEGVFDNQDAIEGEFKVISTGAKSYDLVPADPRELTTAQMAKLLPYRKLMESFFTQMQLELTWRANNGEKIPNWKLVKGREGDREWIDPETVAEELEFIGVPEDKVYVKKLASPAQTEESIKAASGLSKKKAASLISHLVRRAPGKPTLAQETDKREEIDDAGSVFDDHGDDDL